MGDEEQKRYILYIPLDNINILWYTTVVIDFCAPPVRDIGQRSMREELRIAHVVRFVFSAGRSTAPI